MSGQERCSEPPCSEMKHLCKSSRSALNTGPLEEHVGEGSGPPTCDEWTTERDEACSVRYACPGYQLSHAHKGHLVYQEDHILFFDGNTYSTVEEDSKPVRVEIPSGYVEVSSLLKAIERSLRSRSRRSGTPSIFS